MLRGVAVEGLNEALGVHRGKVQGAIAEVIHFFRMTVSPARVFAIGFVSGVGAGGGIAALEVGAHGVEPDGAGESAVADAEKFAIPVGGGQPDFEANIGIAGGLDHAGHAAEGGEFIERVAVGRRECAGGNGLRRGDAGVGEGRGGEAFTGSGAGGKDCGGGEGGVGDQSAH